MPKTVSASEAKNNLGTLISWVRKDDESVIVENRGAPAAAIISIAEYEKLQVLKEKARREEALAELRKLRAELEERQKDMTEEEANALVEEISRDVMEAVIAKTQLRFEE
jgi:prevent-host-death family protein